MVLTGIPLEELTSEQQQAVTTGIISQDPFYLDELECDPLKFDMSDAVRRIACVLSPEARDRIQIGLRSLSIPALLLSGDSELFCPPELIERWKSRIPRASAHVFPETYHDLINDLAHIEVATMIADVALEWSRRTPPPE